jgi:hypothetical protein
VSTLVDARRELKHLNPWHHILLLLFGLVPREEPELVVIFMIISSSSKLFSNEKTCCIFYVGGFTGSSFGKVTSLTYCFFSLYGY